MKLRHAAALALMVAVILLNIGLIAAGTFELGELIWIGLCVVVVSLISFRWWR
jgi:hypothetical protein